MTVKINGESREFDAVEFGNVDELLEEMGLTGHPVLVELNGRALLKGEFEKNPIQDGDEVEIVRMVAGG